MEAAKKKKNKIDKKQLKKWLGHDFKVNYEAPDGMLLVSVYVQKEGNEHGLIKLGHINPSSKVYFKYHNAVRVLAANDLSSFKEGDMARFRKQSDTEPFLSKKGGAYIDSTTNRPNSNLEVRPDNIQKVEERWQIPFEMRYEPFSLDVFNPITAEDTPENLERNVYLVPEGMFIKFKNFDLLHN